MGDRINYAATAHFALREHRYLQAVEQTREGLLYYLDRPSEPDRHTPWSLVQKRYGRLAAAFDAVDIFDLMERAIERLLREEPQLKEANWTPLEDIATFRVDVETMHWIRECAQNSDGVSIVELSSMALDLERTRIKTCILWMEKAGSIHLIGEHVRIGLASINELSLIPSVAAEVPRFKSYSAQTVDMNEDQREYFARFKDQFLAGTAPDIDEQWSYGFVVFHQLMRKGLTNFSKLRASLELAEASYPDSPLHVFANRWLADTYFLDSDFQKGWDVLSRVGLPLDIYLTLSEFVEDSRLTADTLNFWQLEGVGITDALSPKRNDIEDVVNELLDASHEALGHSLISDLWLRLMVHRAKGAPSTIVEDEFGKFLSQQKLNMYLEHCDEDREKPPGQAFQGTADKSRDVIWPSQFRTTYWFTQIVRARINSLFRDAENIVRNENLLPSVGEGWISEVTLFRAISETFPDRRVVHQGRPIWLRKQSLDIYFPNENIGIEYQGAQHSRPVALFGGEIVFQKQLERDERKRGLCAENDCFLIEVFPDYGIDEVILKVQTALSERQQM